MRVLETFLIEGELPAAFLKILELANCSGEYQMRALATDKQHGVHIYEFLHLQKNIENEQLLSRFVERRCIKIQMNVADEF